MATKIFLDPGHGGSDAGAVGNGLQEKDVTLKIALETRRILLEEYEGVTVKMSREKDATVSLTQRTDAANAWNATFYLSIHINAGGGTGFESYRYVQNGSSTTMTAQRNLHAAVLSASGWKDRGQKWANFHVLRESKMPAVLTENGFIDTSGDAAKLKETSFLKKLGRAHAEGLAKTFGLKKKTTPPPAGTLYRIIAGSYEDRTTAENQQSSLKKKGIDTWLWEYEKGKYRVVAGSYSNKSEADKASADLKKKGIENWIAVVEQ
ncbi:N-acetylmuramoyl-L-alanine amidase [Kroppenstedtia eburnea]|uniref:N-acetylmuramoyl-L-alanine amidase n=1 Tax=Kroppenstedtia eburnea TaxID=714067 RepID=UPI0036338007